mgnify:CR=1 FL=1
MLFAVPHPAAVPVGRPTLRNRRRASLHLCWALALFCASPAALASSLVVSATAPGAVTHDLTAVGTTHWKHFGRNDVDTVNQRAGSPDLIGPCLLYTSPSPRDNDW